jgi:hypothetical protein
MLVPDRYTGDPVVCFSRSPGEAAYWAILPRDDDECRGAVLVFDRDRLAMRHRLEPVDNAFFDVDEQEERVWERDVLLADGLVGIAIQPQRFLGRGNRQAMHHNVRRLLTEMAVPHRQSPPRWET